MANIEKITKVIDGVEYDIEFHQEEHKYYVNGEEVPSITTLIGIISSFLYEGVNGFAMSKARVKGRAVHKWFRMFMKFGFEDNTPNDKWEKEKNMIKEWKANLPEHKVLGDEEIMYSPTLRVIGRYDILMEIEGYAKKMLGDFKTTRNLYPILLELQLAFHKYAYKEEYGEDVDVFCIGVHEKYKDKKAQFIELETNEDHIATIKAFVSIWELKRDIEKEVQEEENAKLMRRAERLEKKRVKLVDELKDYSAEELGMLDAFVEHCSEECILDDAMCDEEPEWIYEQLNELSVDELTETKENMKEGK